MEPRFRADPYRPLVPQITVTAGAHTVNLLDTGHRIADASIRFSNLSEEIRGAFKAWNAGDATPLARLAPTSIVFGVWDSRESHAKCPRIVRSVIRAYNVMPLTRSAQYVPPFEYSKMEELEGLDLETKGSEHGLAPVPSTDTHGASLPETGSSEKPCSTSSP